MRDREGQTPVPGAGPCDETCARSCFPWKFTQRGTAEHPRSRRPRTTPPATSPSSPPCGRTPAHALAPGVGIDERAASCTESCALTPPWTRFPARPLARSARGVWRPCPMHSSLPHLLPDVACTAAACSLQPAAHRAQRWRRAPHAPRALCPTATQPSSTRRSGPTARCRST